MSASALASGGFLAPLASSGGGGGGPSGTLVPFELRDVNGTLQAGVTGLSVSVSVDGGSFSTALGSAPNSIGGGAYTYQLDSSEIGTQFTLVRVTKTGFQDVIQEKDFGDVATGTNLAADTVTITNAIIAAQTALAAAISAAQTAINAHTDADTSTTNTNVATILSTLNALVTSATASLSTLTIGLANVQTRLPTALDGNGNIKAGTQTIAAGAITSSQIETGAIGSNQIAAGAIGASQIASNAIGAAQIASDALAAVANAVATTVIYGTSRTVRGVLKRLDRMLIGRASGMDTPLATFYDEDNTTPVVQFAQDTTVGNRTAATTATGD